MQKDVASIVFDFKGIDFDAVEAGVEKVLIGDENPDTPSASTVKNVGNTKVVLQMKASEMKKQ